MHPLGPSVLPTTPHQKLLSCMCPLGPSFLPAACFASFLPPAHQKMYSCTEPEARKVAVVATASVSGDGRGAGGARGSPSSLPSQMGSNTSARSALPAARSHRCGAGEGRGE